MCINEIAVSRFLFLLSTKSLCGPVHRRIFTNFKTDSDELSNYMTVAMQTDETNAKAQRRFFRFLFLSCNLINKYHNYSNFNIRPTVCSILS